MPKEYPQDGFFYPTPMTLMIDSYNLCVNSVVLKKPSCNTVFFTGKFILKLYTIIILNEYINVFIFAK